MTGETRMGRMLYALQRFVTFFLLVAFVVTCCTMLFISELQRTMGFSFTQDNIQLAAKFTFLNVLLITTLFTSFDALRRRLMIERPLRRITAAAQKIMEGDFSVRIPVTGSIDRMDALQEVAICFNRMAEALAGTETLQTDFIANVSHELKSPLAVIRNYALLLQQPGLPEHQRMEYAHAAAEASNRLAGLVTNILRLNKLENQQISPHRETYNLSEQLCECLIAFESAWEEKGLQIKTDIEEDVLISGDAELLTLVWNNLFSNAVKFTPAGGSVSLSLHTEGAYAVAAISDTGCGFGSSVGAHIFDKFYQGDPSHATQGNGLGLALVKRVIQLCGGEISVKSAVGQGSTFTVRLMRTTSPQISSSSGETI